jgi:hypothetical protein
VIFKLSDRACREEFTVPTDWMLLR